MRKGLSPVVAAILLIVVTVFVTIGVMTWASTYSKEKMSESAKASETLSCTGLFLNLIDAVEFSNNQVTFTVKNIGSSAVNSTEQIILWDDNTVTKTSKSIYADVGDIVSVTLTDSDVTSGNNFTTQSGKKITRLEVVPVGCESTPIPLVG